MEGVCIWWFYCISRNALYSSQRAIQTATTARALIHCLSQGLSTNLQDLSLGSLKGSLKLIHINGPMGKGIFCHKGRSWCTNTAGKCAVWGPARAHCDSPESEPYTTSYVSPHLTCPRAAQCILRSSVMLTCSPKQAFQCHQTIQKEMIAVYVISWSCCRDHRVLPCQLRSNILQGAFWHVYGTSGLPIIKH